MRRLSFIISVTALLISSSAIAKTFNVVTTVKPLNLIVSELTQGAATSESIIPAGVSPHDYALRPSDVRKIKNAGLVIWVGPELESFLTKVIATKPENIALTEQQGINFLYYADGEQEQHNNHDGHDHMHEGINPHIWLGPKQAIQAANVITKALIKYDPTHESIYRANLAKFTTEVQQEITKLTQELKPVQDKGYFVFHDGYSYFEQQFDLDNLGHFTVEPDRRPGAKTLLTIRKALQANKAYCVFSEPQFSPAVIESVINGTNVKIGTLDPMATNITAGNGGYIKFLNQLGQSYISCLQP